MARIALALAALSATFWITSWPPSFFAREFPNCIAAGVNTQYGNAVLVSNRGVASTFVSVSRRRSLDNSVPRLSWTERKDPHYCDLLRPPTAAFQSGWGVSLHMAHSAIGCDLPYWLLGVVWLATFFKLRRKLRVSTLDLLVAVSVVAVAFGLTVARCGLLLALPLSLATLGLLLLFFVNAIRGFISASNPWWPLLLPDGRPASTSAKSSS